MLLNQNLKPEGNRIESLDAVRGVALLGILIVNSLSFHAPYFFYGGEGDYSATDNVLLMVIDMFVQASFYPLFSLLFGIGLYMMYNRQLKITDRPYSILIRRMIILAAIGVIHGIFLWYGDILLTYAVFGMISLLFIHKKPASILKWALSLLMIPTILMTWSFYSMRNELSSLGNQTAIAESIDAFKGSYSDIFQQNLTNWLMSYDIYQWIIMLFIILPMMLLGIMIQKKGWLKNINTHANELKWWLLISFILFASFKMVPYLFGMPIWFEYAQDVIGGSFSSLFYFILFIFLFKGRYLQFIRRILSNAGKLSLTNYVTQSVICFFIFYGVGFNLYNELSIGTLLIIVFTIYIVQLLVSNWYVKRYKFGPLEWVYRSLTYQAFQPMKKEGAR